MLRFLSDVGSATGKAVSLYLPPSVSAPEIESLRKDNSIDESFSPDIVSTLDNSETGGVLFWGWQHRCLIIPPFPIREKQVFSNYQIDPLYSLLDQKLTIALILVRLGDYAVGVFEGERRVSSKVGTGLVHSRHKKGGSSQRRFERHREKQIEMFFNRVCGHAREQLGPYAKDLDYVIYGGEENTLRAFRKQCHFLESFDDKTLAIRLNVRRPKQADLETAIAGVWSSEVIEWVEADYDG